MIKFAENNLRHLSVNSFLFFTNFYFYQKINLLSICNLADIIPNANRYLVIHLTIFVVMIQKFPDTLDTKADHDNQNHMTKKFFLSNKVQLIYKNFET